MRATLAALPPLPRRREGRQKKKDGPLVFLSLRWRGDVKKKKRGGTSCRSSVADIPRSCTPAATACLAVRPSLLTLPYFF